MQPATTVPPASAPATTAAPTEDAAARVFSTSIMLSAIRCTLAYIVFPWLLPAIGVAGGVGPGIGAVVSVVAIGFNVASIRRFHRADHRWKWPVSALNATVIVMLTTLLVQDLVDLVG